MGEDGIKNKNKKRNIIAITLVIIIVFGSLFSLRFLHEKRVNNASGAIIQEGIIPGYNAEQIEEILQRKADESVFSFEINSRPVFKDGKSEGNVRIANPPYSKYAITVDIKTEDDSKGLFKSEEIKPNHYIENIKLDKVLKKGKYNSIATINAYDLKSGELMGTSSAKLVIEIKR